MIDSDVRVTDVRVTDMRVTYACVIGSSALRHWLSLAEQIRDYLLN